MKSDPVKLAEKRRKVSSGQDPGEGVYRLSPASPTYRLSPSASPSYRISPRPSQTVMATFHQRSGRRGLSSKFRGYQCTSMALAAIIVSKTLPLQSWRTTDLDAILRYGDLLHIDMLYKRGRRLDDPRLALHEIPTGENNTYNVPVPNPNEKWFSREYPTRQCLTLSKTDDYYGLVHPPNNAFHQRHQDLGYTSMEDALGAIFEQDIDGVLITVSDISGAVFKDSDGNIRYFDSHSNNKYGRLSLEGTAVLLTLENILGFIRLIRKREPRTSYRYELIGVKVHLENENKNVAETNESGGSTDSNDSADEQSY